MTNGWFVLEVFQRQTQAILATFALLFVTNTSLESIKHGLLQQMYVMLHSIQKEKGYYTIARKYEFYVRLAKQYLTSAPSERVRLSFLPPEHKINLLEPT